MATLSKKSSYTRAGSNGGATSASASATGATGTKSKASKSARSAAPTHDDIAARAYEYYVQRGCVEGHADEDWARAEAELRGQG